MRKNRLYVSSFVHFSALLSTRRTSVILQLLNAPHIFILFRTHLSHHILPFIHCTYQLLYSTLSSLRLPFLCLFVSDLHYGHPAPTYIPSNLLHTYCYLSRIVPSLTVYIIFFLRSFIQTFACSLRQFCLILLFVVCHVVIVFLGGKYFFCYLDTLEDGGAAEDVRQIGNQPGSGIFVQGI